MADDANNSETLSRWWAAPSLLIGGGILWIVSRVGPMAMAEAAGFSAGIFALMVRVLWRHHCEKWFWPAAITMALAHVGFILFFPWPRLHEFSKGDLVFIWVDFFVYLGLGFLADWLKPSWAKSSNVR